MNPRFGLSEQTLYERILRFRLLDKSEKNGNPLDRLTSFVYDVFRTIFGGGGYEL